MSFDLREIHTESDLHGEPCPVCADRPAVTNVYVTTPDADDDTRHTCEAVECLIHTVTVHHHGDGTPIVELSMAPMPWTLADFPAPATPAITAGDLGCVTGSVRSAGRVA